MIFITEESEIQINEGIVGLYFYSSWMPFHKKMLIMISKIEDKYKDIQFYAIDTDHFKSLCKRFDINEIPTVTVWSRNKEIKKIVGLTMTSAFKSAFNDICNTK